MSDVSDTTATPAKTAEGRISDGQSAENGSSVRIQGATEPEPDPARPLRTHALPGLDGVRGIAILLVMLYHFAAMKPACGFDKIFYRLTYYGWSGVDLFFVLSGFLITGILIDAKGTGNYFRNFYARRALRILPLYYAFVAGLLLLYPLVGGSKVAHEALVLHQNQWWVWTHLVNWRVAWTGDFWTNTPLGTGGFWSLSIEEQFYLVWPVMILLCPRRHLLRLCLALVIVATAIRFAMAAFGASWAAIFSVTFSRMDAIAMGATIAALARSHGGLKKVKAWTPTIAGLAVAGLVLADLLSRTGYRLKETMQLAVLCTIFVWLWGALVVATLTVAAGTLLQRVTCSLSLRTFGKYSFALYLFHGHANRLFAKIGFNPDHGIVIGPTVLPWQMWYILVSTAASLAVAYLSWHLWEKHFLRLKVLFPTRKRMLAAKGPPMEATPTALFTQPAVALFGSNGENKAVNGTSGGETTERPMVRLRKRVLLWVPVLLPLIILVGTGLRGLDFGLHWDERPWQIGPVKHMVQSRTLLPGYYNYPSFDYWLNLLVLAPDAVASRVAGNDLRTHLLQTLDSHSYLLRLRCVYLLITSLTLLWIYLLVLHRRGSWVEALLAASLLGFSWEVAYHLRWVATDGMLMQFATLAVLLASYALETRREFWLIAAAIMAALAFGTKYPGGLVLLPVGMAAWFMSDGCSLRETTVRLARISAVFVATFLMTTPAILVHPRQVLTAVLYETQHYATGHGGHTVPRGFQHGWRMLEYFGTVLFSSNVAVALFIFVLAIVGISSLMIHNWRAAAVLLSFPIAYVLYFSTQQAMVVRNLLAVAPFLAIAAAVGAGAIKSFLRQRAQTTAAFPGEKFVEVLWVGLLAAVLCWNALWLVGSANSIIARHRDQFMREAAQYVRSHSSTKFLLSPRVKREMAMLQPELDNLTVDLRQADVFLLYAREGMRRWHDWPANRRGLTKASFGPREVNFNMYPNWWGDDRIVVISRRRAEQIGLHIAGISADTPPPAALLSPATAQPKTRVALTSADSLASSWALPSIDPRSLVAKAEAESIAGEMLHGPASGGWELDGTASTYLGSNDLVVSISVISTSAFNLESDAPESVTVGATGAAAYFIPVGPFGDVRLFARSLTNAVIVHLSGGLSGQRGTLDLARQFAGAALKNLDAATQAVQTGANIALPRQR